MTAAAKRVLVVEDDPNVRGLLQTLLAAEGYDVITAADGAAGSDRAAVDPPCLVLLDYATPDAGGAGPLERLRADHVLGGVPVVVVTGQLDAVAGLRAELGAGNVFVKPFGAAELLARVADVTGHDAGAETP